MWRVLIQLPSLISEVIARLRTLCYLQEQTLLLQQETNQLLRELIVKVTTQPAETAPAIELPRPPEAEETALPPRSKAPRKPRVLTEHDIIRNTRHSIAEDQFRAKGLEQYPHRQGEQLPTSPNQTSNRPLGGPPQ